MKIKSKRLLSTLLAAVMVCALLTACGENNTAGSGGSVSGNAGNNSPKSIKDIIKANSLITLEDAESIMGQSMEESEPGVKSSLADEARYVSSEKRAGYTFYVSLYQEAVYEKNKESASEMLNLAMQPGWAKYLESTEKHCIEYDYDPEHNIIKEGEIDSVVYLQKPGTGEAFNQWFLHIFYGEYYIQLELSSSERREDEMSWKPEKLKEAGKLALERLKAIIG